MTCHIYGPCLLITATNWRPAEMDTFALITAVMLIVPTYFTLRF